MEPDIQAFCFGRQHFLRRGRSHTPPVFRTREVVPGAVWIEAQAFVCVLAPRDQDRFGHVQRDERQTSCVVGIVAPGGGCALAMMVEITAFEDGVMRVPEPIADITNTCGLDRRLMDRVVVGLGPLTDQLQSLPVITSFLTVCGNPGILLRRCGRQLFLESLGNGHAVFIKGAYKARRQDHETHDV